MQRYTKKIFFVFLFLGLWTSHTYCFIFSISKFTHFINSEQSRNIFTCHDHHQMGSVENNETQLQNFLCHLKQYPHRKRLIIAESKWFYGIDCLNLTVEQMIQQIQPSFNKKLSYHESPQIEKFTTYISWQLPLALCQEKSNLDETLFCAVDPRLLIDKTRFYLYQKKDILNVCFLALLAQINELLQKAVDCLLNNDDLLSKVPDIFKKSLQESLLNYQRIVDQDIENFTTEDISKFLNQLQDVLEKEYPGSLSFAEPTVSLEILKQILLQSHEFEEIFVFCGTRHALMLEFMLKAYNIEKNCSYGRPYQEIKNQEDNAYLIKELISLFDQLLPTDSNSLPHKPVHHKKKFSRKQLAKSI